MSEQMAYVGTADCGCVQALAIDNPEHRRDVRLEVSKMLRWGTVERWPVPKAATAICFAKHKKNICPHPGECPDFAKAVSS